MGNLVGGGVPLDVVGLNTLVDGYCEAGMMSRALDLVEDGRKNGVEPDIVTYNTLVNGFLFLYLLKVCPSIFFLEISFCGLVYSHGFLS